MHIQSNWTLYLLALISGASLVLASAPFEAWYITPIATAAFLKGLTKTSQANAFKYGFSFGLGWFAASIHWVHVSIAQYGGLPLILSLGMMLLLVAYLALYPALFSYAAVKFFRQKDWFIALPVLWGISEFLRGWVLTGFSWSSIGYGQLHGPLAEWLPLIGESGLSLVLIALGWSLVKIANKGLLNSMAASKFSPAKLTVILIVAIFALPLLLYSFQPQQQADKAVKITLVQGNIMQSLRWVPEQDWPTMEKYLDLTEPYWQSDLIIWPEAAVPKLEPMAQDYLKFVDYKAAESNTAVITGIADYKFDQKLAFNNLIVLGKKHQQDEQGSYLYNHSNRYAKYHLLPIGEFIPLEDWLRGLAPIFDLPMSSFTPGKYLQHNLVANDFKVAANICFEILFAQQLIDNLEADTDFMLTVSNDAWFGHSIGPLQHMEIAQVRAKELGMPIIRATNNGLTGFINANGEITAQAPQFEDAVLSEEVTLDKVSTLYRTTDGMSYWITWLILALFSLRSLKKGVRDK